MPATLADLAPTGRSWEKSQAVVGPEAVAPVVQMPAEKRSSRIRLGIGECLATAMPQIIPVSSAFKVRNASVRLMAARLEQHESLKGPKPVQRFRFAQRLR
jgi:hypothetical protein